MKFLFLLAILPLLLSGCASVQTAPAPVQAGVGMQVVAFSTAAADTLPKEWEPMIIHRGKKRTEYRLVSDQGRKVLHARADSAASGLMQKVNIDPLQQRELSWRWRIGSLVESANNRDRALEDAPARIVLGFDGDKDALPFVDQMLFETARLMTGQDFPYATLMYIRSRKAPIDTIIPSAHSNQIKMIVVASGSDGIGEWHHFSRDIAADYERAFGGKPGRLIGIGVLTDTDNTGETVEAWYGDIRLQRR